MTLFHVALALLPAALLAAACYLEHARRERMRRHLAPLLLPPTWDLQDQRWNPDCAHAWWRQVELASEAA